MTEITKELISKIESISDNVHAPLEKRLMDTAVWFHKNKDRIPRDDPIKRLDFLEKVLDIHLEMVAMMVDRVQKAEGRSKSQSLWLPNGMKAFTDEGKEIDFG